MSILHLSVVKQPKLCHSAPVHVVAPCPGQIEELLERLELVDLL